MSKRNHDYDDSLPGSRFSYDGTDYVAVEATTFDCKYCAFDNDSNACNAAPSGCGQHQTVWLTPLNAITYRLTK